MVSLDLNALPQHRQPLLRGLDHTQRHWRSEQPGGQLIPVHPVMLGHFAEDRGEGADLERAVIGDGDVVDTIDIRRQPDMAPALACDRIAQRA